MKPRKSPGKFKPRATSKLTGDKGRLTKAQRRQLKQAYLKAQRPRPGELPGGGPVARTGGFEAQKRKPVTAERPDKKRIARPPKELSEKVTNLRAEVLRLNELVRTEQLARKDAEELYGLADKEAELNRVLASLHAQGMDYEIEQGKRTALKYAQMRVGAERRNAERYARERERKLADRRAGRDAALREKINKEREDLGRTLKDLERQLNEKDAELKRLAKSGRATKEQLSRVQRELEILERDYSGLEKDHRVAASVYRGRISLLEEDLAKKDAHYKKARKQAIINNEKFKKERDARSLLEWEKAFSDVVAYKRQVENYITAQAAMSMFMQQQAMLAAMGAAPLVQQGLVHSPINTGFNWFEHTFPQMGLPQYSGFHPSMAAMMTNPYAAMLAMFGYHPHEPLPEKVKQEVEKVEEKIQKINTFTASTRDPRYKELVDELTAEGIKFDEKKEALLDVSKGKRWYDRSFLRFLNKYADRVTLTWTVEDFKEAAVLNKVAEDLEEETGREVPRALTPAEEQLAAVNWLKEQLDAMAAGKTAA